MSRKPPPPELTAGNAPYQAPRGYRLERVLGSGASADVWLALRLVDGASVALKAGRDAQQAPRLAAEAERLCWTESRSLSRVLDAGFMTSAPAQQSTRAQSKVPYVVFSWAPGAAVEPRSVASAEVRLRLAAAIARDIGEALADLHALGWAHGDVKPHNIIAANSADGDCETRLVDLGLAQPEFGASASGGTLRYLAPEVFDAPGALVASTARTRDLWALGMTLAEVLDPEVLAVGRDEVRDVMRAPEPWRRLVRALLEREPFTRPAAEWVAREARLLSNQPWSAGEVQARSLRQVKASYLSLHQSELHRIASGAPARVDVGGIAGQWLREVSELLAKVSLLRGASDATAVPLQETSAFARQRWLVRLLGAPIAHFPPLLSESDSELAERLLRLAERQDLRSIRYADLVEVTTVPPPLSDAPILLAARLSAGSYSQAAFEAARRQIRDLGQSAEARQLKYILALALRRHGEWPEALLLFDELGDAEALAHAAELCRRLGDRAGVERRLTALAQAADAAHVSIARGRSVEARLKFGAGDFAGARELLANSPLLGPVLEVQALLELEAGNVAAAEDLALRLASLATDAEEAARAETLLGSVEHARGEPRLAFDAFRRAADYAARSGAWLEEATYLTNVAASAVDLGEFKVGCDTARRAVLLFEHLGQDKAAARAALALTAAYSCLGIRSEAEAWAQEALRRARAQHDVRCEAYVHLARADAADVMAPEAKEHAERAWHLLERGNPDDELRALARLHKFSVLPRDLAVIDTQAMSEHIAADARLDWWGARASCAVEQSTYTGKPALEILEQVTRLVSLPIAVACRGPNLSLAAELARRQGQGEIARRLVHEAALVVKQIEHGAPASFREKVRHLPWVRRLAEPKPTPIREEQVADLENLVRSLGTRDGLGPLLNQVLDALVLWTGVERGLLLLRAPEGRLVPRAARNLARRDLSGLQLELSHSIAERALESREPVVAVDAAGELSELHHSVHVLGLRSVLAVPLIARGETLGVVYLDDRTRRGAFGSSELGWVRLVGTLAAVAIADTRDQLRLRRTARRAERAERRLAGTLRQRDAEIEYLEREVARDSARGSRFAYSAIIGQSSAIRGLLARLDRVSTSEVPVHISGESGTGKELVARALHENGKRNKGPFVSENCSAIPEPLLESTLFGHAKGAFTGASRMRVGLFEVADGGTLFLDEVGEMSPAMQAKLLRVIETGEVRPVGSERVRKVDVRVLTATHRNLEKMAAAGSFRQDLLYRLNVIEVAVPALRERRDDIPLLVRHFLNKYAPGQDIVLTAAALEALRAYDWPGNVRELENEVRRLLVMSDGSIDVAELSPAVRSGRGGGPKHEFDLPGRIDALELELVTLALQRTQGNQTKAAELLNISRFGLQKMMKRLSIEHTFGRAGGHAGRSQDSTLTETSS